MHCEPDGIICINIWILVLVPNAMQCNTIININNYYYYVRTAVYIITYYAQEVLPYGQTTLLHKINWPIPVVWQMQDSRLHSMRLRAWT